MREPVPLSRVAGLPTRVVDHFAYKGFSTADHVMEIAAMLGGMNMLRGELAELGLSDAEADASISAIRSALDPAALEQGSHPLDVSKFGLGAKDPSDREP